MKTTRILLLTALCSLLTLLAFAQVVSSSTALVRIQTDPPAGRVQAFFERTVTVDGVAYRQPWQEVSWALGDNSPVAITLADGSPAQTTRAAIFAAVAAIAAEEKAKADAR